MKYSAKGAKSTDRPSDLRAARVATIVTTGNGMLDAAIAVDRTVAPSLRELQQACRRGTAAAPLPHAETRSFSTGRPASSMALTMDRGGRGPALHVATTHRIIDVRRRARTITVWHELATFDCN